jgi:hypothetical protein
MKTMKTSLVLFLAILIATPLLCMADKAKCPCKNSKAKSRYQCGVSLFVPFVNAETNTNLEASPTINVGFNGDPGFHPFIMDTGSCGIVATPDYFKHAPDAENLGPAETFYDSDGTTII